MRFILLFRLITGCSSSKYEFKNGDCYSTGKDSVMRKILKRSKNGGFLGCKYNLDTEHDIPECNLHFIAPDNELAGAILLPCPEEFEKELR